VGKSVRALHLYEEMGLLHPAERSAGGFRLFDHSAVARIRWILNLQAIGFSLSEIQEFVREFEEAASGKVAATKVREVFQAKLHDVREQLAQLRSIERDLEESIEYLESCQTCAETLGPSECRACNHHGHQIGATPTLFAGISGADQSGEGDGFDVAASNLSQRTGAADTTN
ncbi:MAG: MerR family DNA-binding protein, partial [Deltaproteobacteria bacterium]|nr:MerR family DNA-binding protein [Deltaproteobacteria bacterium]